MQPLFWKTLAALLFLCLLVQQFSSGRWASPAAPPTGQFHFDRATSADGWTFDWSHHGNNHGLSPAQCDAAFPDLYAEIDRAVAQWAGRAISSDTIELFEQNEAGVRVLLHNSQLRVVATKGMHRADFRTRIYAVLSQINRAVIGVESFVAFPDMEFTIAVDDWPTLPDGRERTVWSFTRDGRDSQHDDVWLIPDFHFWAAPPESKGFWDMQADARQHDALIVHKKPQVVWRGVVWTAPAIRGGLINATRGQPWADVEQIRWEESDPNRKNVMTMDKFCDYAFVVNTEGRSWSSRLTYILNCDSVVVSHPLRYPTHYSHLLDPSVNCVPVTSDFTDLGEKVLALLGDPAAAQQIADRSRATFRERYTTPAATACYWRRLLATWAAVSFTPSVFEQVVSEDGRRVKRMRGIGLDEFLFHKDRETDYPYGTGP